MRRCTGDLRPRMIGRAKILLGLLLLYVVAAACVYPNPLLLYDKYRVALHRDFAVRVVGLGTDSAYLEWRAKRYNYQQETMPDPLLGRAPLDLANSGCTGTPTLWTKPDEYNPAVQIEDVAFTEIRETSRDLLFRIVENGYVPQPNAGFNQLLFLYRHIGEDPCRALVERTIDGSSKHQSSALVVISGSGKRWLDVEVPR